MSAVRQFKFYLRSFRASQGEADERGTEKESFGETFGPSQIGTTPLTV
jgi:hypothetical protein